MEKPPRYELYDLQADPYEFRNLADSPDHAAACAELKQALADWREETKDPLLDPANLERLTAEVTNVKSKAAGKELGCGLSRLLFRQRTGGQVATPRPRPESRPRRKKRSSQPNEPIDPHPEYPVAVTAADVGFGQRGGAGDCHFHIQAEREFGERPGTPGFPRSAPFVAPAKQLWQVRGGTNIVTARDGTVIAFQSMASNKIRRSPDGGRTWGRRSVIGPGATYGNAVVDETGGDILYVNPAKQWLWRSRDHGLTWAHESITVRPDGLHHRPAGTRVRAVAGGEGIRSPILLFRSVQRRPRSR